MADDGDVRKLSVLKECKKVEIGTLKNVFFYIPRNTREPIMDVPQKM